MLEVEGFLHASEFLSGFKAVTELFFKSNENLGTFAFIGHSTSNGSLKSTPFIHTYIDFFSQLDLIVSLDKALTGIIEDAVVTLITPKANKVFIFLFNFIK